VEQLRKQSGFEDPKKIPLIIDENIEIAAKKRKQIFDEIKEVLAKEGFEVKTITDLKLIGAKDETIRKLMDNLEIPGIITAEVPGRKPGEGFGSKTIHIKLGKPPVITKSSTVLLQAMPKLSKFK
jgi:hypothetical protein